MKLFKNVIEDAFEYNQAIVKLNSRGKPIDIEPVEINKVITISLEEYKELLIYKGKYLGLTNETTITSLYADGTKFEEMVKDESR